MLILMKSWRKIPARIIPNVSDVMFMRDDMVWRIGRSKDFNHSIGLDTMESDYRIVYIMGEDTCVMGCNSLIKWVVWNHFIIAEMTEAAAKAYIQRNPIK